MEFKLVSVKKQDIEEVVELYSFFKWELLKNIKTKTTIKLYFTRNMNVDNYLKIKTLEKNYFNIRDNNKTFKIKLMTLSFISVLICFLTLLLFKGNIIVIFFLIFILIFITIILVRISLKSNKRKNFKAYQVELEKINILKEVIKLH